jgi:hypothetical protein
MMPAINDRRIELRASSRRRFGHSLALRACRHLSGAAVLDLRVQGVPGSHKEEKSNACRNRRTGLP